MFYDVLLRLCLTCMFNHLVDNNSLQGRVFGKNGKFLNVPKSIKVLDEYYKRLQLPTAVCVHVELYRQLMGDVQRVNRTFKNYKRDHPPNRQ